MPRHFSCGTPNKILSWVAPIHTKSLNITYLVHSFDHFPGFRKQQKCLETTTNKLSNKGNQYGHRPPQLFLLFPVLTHPRSIIALSDILEHAASISARCSFSSTWLIPTLTTATSRVSGTLISAFLYCAFEKDAKRVRPNEEIDSYCHYRRSWSDVVACDAFGCQSIEVGWQPFS